MCTVIDLLRTLIEEQRVLIKIEFNRTTTMFELLSASIELAARNYLQYRRHSPNREILS